MTARGRVMVEVYTIMRYNVNMEQKRAYKYRCYPTDEQKQILARTFGCARFVYNWALRQKTDAIYQENKHLYYKDLSECLDTPEATRCILLAFGGIFCSLAASIASS